MALALDFEQALRTVRSEVGGSRLQGIAAATPGTPADFFRRNLTHAKGPAAGQRLKLEPWQRRFVDELYRTDERGQRVYKRAVLGVPRGNGKSPLAAGLGLYELMTRTDEPDVICAAAARDQAGVVFEYARGFAESSPIADELVIGRREIGRPETRGVLRTISADGYVAHGANPSAVIIDEAHAFTTHRQRELFEALDTSVMKRPDAFWLLITTAGHDRDSCSGSSSRKSSSSSSPRGPSRDSPSPRTRRTGCCCTGTALMRSATPTTRSCGRPSTRRPG
jgi:phage terminase large subunit-like protein